MEINWINVLMTPLVGAITGFGVWYFQSRIEKLRREQERLHSDRRKVYSDVLEPFVRIFAGIKNPKETQRALQQIQSFDYKRTAFEFSLIGADEVVRSFNELMQYIFSHDPDSGGTADSGELMYRWGAFLLEIRRNVGNPKTRLKPPDMLRSQIKEIDEFLKRQS